MTPDLQLVLIYRPRRDGRLSRPWCEVAPSEIRTCNLPITSQTLHDHTGTSALVQGVRYGDLVSVPRPMFSGLGLGLGLEQFGLKAKAKQKAKMCNGRRHVPLCPASANEKYIV